VGGPGGEFDGESVDVDAWVGEHIVIAAQFTQMEW
jgi:hypothetical protein